MAITPAEYKALVTKAKGIKQDDHSKKAMITIGDITFYARSSWEANIAAYYESLRKAGEILKWEHEPHTFWFLEIKRGVRSYLPDFRITKRDGAQYFVEVKGYMDKKSATKLKRMKKYYPVVEVQLIDKIRYREISRSAKFIKQWGMIK